MHLNQGTENPEMTNKQGLLLPCRNGATKRTALQEEMPHQHNKRQKIVRGWRVTTLTPRPVPQPGQDPSRKPNKKRPAEASPHQPKKVRKAIEQPVKVKQASKTKEAPETPLLQGSNKDEGRARHYLTHLGVRLLKEETITKMISLGSQSLGKGAFGSCCKGIHAGKEVVIKTFLNDALRCLVTEARSLHRLQGRGMQRLVGVCLETRQLVTRFAGQTAADYFHPGVCFSDAISVILQVAQVVRKVNNSGYTHNDIKNNNVCVEQSVNGPKATVIDLGLAMPVGKRGLYKTSKDISEKTRKHPWIAPELFLGSYPCSAASDVYSVAWFILSMPSPQGYPTKNPTMRLFKDWVRKAREPHPEKRPSLDDLIRVIKQLQAEMK